MLRVLLIAGAFIEMIKNCQRILNSKIITFQTSNEFVELPSNGASIIINHKFRAVKGISLK